MRTMSTGTVLTLEGIVDFIDLQFVTPRRENTHLASMTRGQWEVLKASLKNPQPTLEVSDETSSG